MEIEAVDYLPDSQEDKLNKEIIHDVLFNYKSEIIPTRNNVITVDCEMENSKQNYSISGRGTYYAAKLHSQTIEKGQNYNFSNKVYSIWLLNYKNWHDDIAIRSIYQAMTYTEQRTVELMGENKRSKGYDRESDGLEVVYIELPKVDNDNIGKELKDMLLSIRDGNDIIDVIKAICGLEQKEVEIMQTNLRVMNVKVNPYIEMGRQEGRQTEKTEAAKKMISLGIDMETIITVTELTEEEIKLLMRVN